MAPTGGPADTTPPTILETYPSSGTTNFHDDVFRISFSEYVDKRSVDESIFLSPDLGELELDWSGTDVEIKFTDSLRANTTYVLTLGTDVKDLRNGNRLAESFSLAFSTGDHIDSGVIAGKIFDEKPEGVMLFAYLLDNKNGDTLNPNHTKPDYLTQTGKDGTFLLPYLRLGNYRLIAVRDEYKNLFYDQQTDQFGVPQSEFSLTAERNVLQHVQLQLTIEDTSAPFLSSARALDQQHVLLRFSEQIDSSSLRAENLSIVDTLTNTRLSVIDVSPSDTSLSEAVILTTPQDSSKTYRVAISQSRDILGNIMLSTSKPVDFDGSGSPDTTKAKITLLNIPNDNKDVFPEDSIHIAISEWVLKQKFEQSFSLFDSSKKKIDGNYHWWNTTHGTFTPKSPLTYGMPYTFNIILDSVVDVAGNLFADSVQVFKFQVVDKDKLGTISGTVQNENANDSAKIFLSAIPLSSGVRKRQLVLGKSGSFLFDNLEEGKYVLTAFVDSDSNKAYSYGTLIPFKPSERFTFYSDTLKVRARWSVEGMNVRLKR
ncbi:MAG: Ig-like domain-containing protein [Ignavibacteriae bacterium]|nr:Ig-like domain-containing protein [Ignavibacteriota bacterium]